VNLVLGGYDSRIFLPLSKRKRKWKETILREMTWEVVRCSILYFC